MKEKAMSQINNAEIKDAQTVEQVRKKAKENDKNIFDAAMSTLIWGVLFFCAHIRINSQTAPPDSFRATVFQATLYIATAFGFALFGIFLIVTLGVKLSYHIAEKKMKRKANSDFYFGTVNLDKISCDPHSLTDRGITFGVLGKGQSFTVEDKTAEKEGESNGTPV